PMHKNTGERALAKGDLVIAADFGTSGVKVGVVDDQLTLLARVTETYPLSLSPGGRAEQDPNDWWAALERALAALHKDMPDLRTRAGAIVFCGQVCGVVCADKDGKPLRPCLTWMDKRAAEVGNRLVGGFPSVRGYRVDKGLLWLALANGAPAQNGMDPTAKILWVKENEPDVFDRTRWFLDVRDWLVHRATGKFTTCPESANLSWVMNTRRGREGWSETLSRLAGIPIDRMPPIVAGDQKVGGLTEDAANALGLSTDVQVLGGGADVTAATLGTGEVEDGALHISVATSAWIAGFFKGRRVSIPHAYATITSCLDYRPLLIASQENAGSAMQWAMQVIGDGQGFTDIGRVRLEDPFFLPWLTGERVPVDDHDLR
ncbi:FGGY family carbohydrate kinase, partial [Roseobacter sp.]|uniref:FGGY family carbohydrate kinase n=1 Tax=Roseobacter sp. TaxID=1907202 RepID=UPI003298E7CE